MVAALHSSKPDGSKHFRRNGTNFGWETIVSMWERDLARTDPKNGGLLTQLPGMRESYIHRDSWTRLNVKPAKIMQVIMHISKLHVQCILGYLNPFGLEVVPRCSDNFK